MDTTLLGPGGWTPTVTVTLVDACSISSGAGASGVPYQRTSPSLASCITLARPFGPLLSLRPLSLNRRRSRGRQLRAELHDGQRVFDARRKSFVDAKHIARGAVDVQKLG